MIKDYNDPNSLICRIEVVEGQCVTIFGRVNDDPKRWSEEMQKLIKAVSPNTTCHRSDEERARFHPNGSPKKTGYKYFHHVHSDFDLEETLKRAANWLPKEE